MSQVDLAELLKVDSATFSEGIVKRTKVFPTFRVMKGIAEAITDKVPKGFNENDITDLAFISQTLAYFDVVTVDKRMGARIADANLDEFVYGEVVRKFDDLRPAVERALERA